ncbi:MAG: glycoside hydrolase family 5 protein [Kiritimatiellae bacterium]|jgi:endoglucanase|nr:glycoside hydrolase family 5 protein [Kiritimatiellia bacterium]
MKFSRLFPAFLLFVGFCSVRAQSHISNGSFEQVQQNGIPAGWNRAGEEEIGKIFPMREDGVSYIRMQVEAPDQLVGIEQNVPLPPGVQGVEFHARFRNENIKFGKSYLKDARTRFQFHDAEGNPVGKRPGDVIFDSHAREWRNVSEKFLVPKDAVSVRILVCLNQPASGTLDVQAVQLVNMDPAEAREKAQIPLMAAQKKSADEAEIQQLLDLPPKSRKVGVSGNKIVNDLGDTVLLQGVNVPSLEWSAKGENVLRSMKVALVDWEANVVRLPVSSSLWFGRGRKKMESNDAEAYRKVVDDAIRIAAGQGAYLILDLHSYGAPRETAVEFWADAAKRYANHPAVIFDLYNEPHGISWDHWQNGGAKTVKDKKTKKETVIQVVGMQQLVNTVRAAGAKNLIFASGTSYALNLSGILEGHALTDPGGYGIGYSTHFYNWHKNWEKHFLQVAEKYPVIVGEFGADVKKMSFIPSNHQENPHTFIPDALGMIQKHKLHWTAFSMHPKATPVLIQNWNYDPTPFFGAYVLEALKGKTFEPGMR